MEIYFMIVFLLTTVALGVLYLTEKKRWFNAWETAETEKIGLQYDLKWAEIDAERARKNYQELTSNEREIEKLSHYLEKIPNTEHYRFKRVCDKIELHLGIRAVDQKPLCPVCKDPISKDDDVGYTNSRRIAHAGCDGVNPLT